MQTSPPLPPTPPPRTATLHRGITLLGGLNALILLSYTLLSWPMAAGHPDGAKQAAAQSALARAAGLDDQAVAFAGGRPFSSMTVFAATYGVHLVLLTITFLGLLLLLARHQDELSDATVTLLFRFSAAFAGICAFASPLILDFWLSLAWGKMVALGRNPYYMPRTEDVLAGIPLDPGGTMTYGPLWATISGALMAIAGGNPIIGFVLFRVLFAVAWLSLLWLARALLREHSTWSQCAAIAVLGWMPVSLLRIYADGHNDIALVAFIAGWLFLLQHGRYRLATLVLTASVLVKYVSAPLLVLDALLAARRREWRSYALTLGLAALFVAFAFAPFLRSLEFFDAMTHGRDWRFWRPRDAVHGLQLLLGVRLPLLPGLVHVFFPALAAFCTARLFTRPGNGELWLAVIAVMGAVAFNAVGHLWPWYVLWLMLPAALIANGWWGRWVVGLALALPFGMLCWDLTADGDVRNRLVSLGMYGFSVFWATVLARLFYPAARPAVAPLAAAGTR